MKKLITAFVTLLSVNAFANTNFTCTVSAIPQHAEYKQFYTVHGDQNPQKITYDFSGPSEQVHYFQVDTFGKLVRGLYPVDTPENYFLRVRFKRVIPPPELELPNGVRIELNAHSRDTYAGLGMRDDYSTYIQDVTGDLPDGTKVLLVLVCTR